MKFIMLLLLSVSVCFAAEQSIELPSTQLGAISLRAAGSAGDPNNGTVSFATPENIADTHFVFANLGGSDFVIYDVINSGTTITPAFTRAIVDISRQPALGTCTLKNTGVIFFTPNGASGDDSIEIRFLTPTIPPGVEIGARRTISIKVLNQRPTISVSASPSLILAGGEASFAATIDDANGHVVSVSYVYGDGSAGINTTHTYASAGVYTVTALADDGFGGKALAQTTVTVVTAAEHEPKARITTSDIVAFVNVPFAMDGITSTDPQSNIVQYIWDFGDETPRGTTASLSHIYSTTGPHTIILLIIDSEGFKDAAVLEIEVLEETAAGTFNSEIILNATYFPQRAYSDVLTVFARVNIGEVELSNGESVFIEIAGQSYPAELNKRLRAHGWTIRKNLRGQPSGTVEVAIRLRNTYIAPVLIALGAVDGAVIFVPVRIGLGFKTISVELLTEFKQGANRGKAFGEF